MLIRKKIVSLQRELKDMVTIRNIYGDVIKTIENVDTLRGVDLSFEHLMFADFRDMDLTDTCFDGADLFGACFRGADISQTKFGTANIEDTDMDILRHVV